MFQLRAVYSVPTLALSDAPCLVTFKLSTPFGLYSVAHKYPTNPANPKIPISTNPNTIFNIFFIFNLIKIEGARKSIYKL